jgi:hypothetical protein
MVIAVGVVAHGFFDPVTLSGAVIAKAHSAGQGPGQKPVNDIVDIPADPQDRFHAQCLEDFLCPGAHASGDDQLNAFFTQKPGYESRLVTRIWDHSLADDAPVDDIDDREERAAPEMGEYFITCR